MELLLGKKRAGNLWLEYNAKPYTHDFGSNKNNLEDILRGYEKLQELAEADKN
jgi:hypothetical protein